MASFDFDCGGVESAGLDPEGKIFIALPCGDGDGTPAVSGASVSIPVHCFVEVTGVYGEECCFTDGKIIEVTCDNLTETLSVPNGGTVSGSLPCCVHGCLPGVGLPGVVEICLPAVQLPLEV